MAVSSQKFLPSGKSGSLAVMPAAKLSMIRKPLVTTSSDGEAKKTVVDIHKKVTSLTFIFRKSRILTKKIIRRKRKSAEIEENRKREEKLEERSVETDFGSEQPHTSKSSTIVVSQSEIFSRVSEQVSFGWFELFISAIAISMKPIPSEQCRSACASPGNMATMLIKKANSLILIRLSKIT